MSQTRLSVVAVSGSGSGPGFGSPLRWLAGAGVYGGRWTERPSQRMGPSTRRHWPTPTAHWHARMARTHGPPHRRPAGCPRVDPCCTPAPAGACWLLAFAPSPTPRADRAQSRRTSHVAAARGRGPRACPLQRQRQRANDAQRALASPPAPAMASGQSTCRPSLHASCACAGARFLLCTERTRRRHEES